jgi:hypothetical protein
MQCRDWLSSSPCLLSTPACHEIERHCKPPRAHPELCRPSATCPRCDEASARPHVCPDPQHLATLAALFNSTFVLCAGRSCERHGRAAAYWPPYMHVEAFDGRELDRTLARRHGAPVAALLGLAPSASPREAHLGYSRHAARTLLAHLELIRHAARRGLPSVLILEADVRPLGGPSALPLAELEALHRRLASPWSVVRISGLYRHYSSSYRRPPAVCPPACRCVGLTAASAHVCEVPAPRGMSAARGLVGVRGDAFCDVRDTAAYAVSARAYPALLRVRDRALAAVWAAAANRSVGQQPWNASFGLGVDDFGAPVDLPWIDILLPAMLDGVRRAAHRSGTRPLPARAPHSASTMLMSSDVRLLATPCGARSDPCAAIAGGAANKAG